MLDDELCLGLRLDDVEQVLRRDAVQVLS